MIRLARQGVFRLEVRESTVHRRSELYFDALRVIEQEYANEELSLTAVAHEIATSRRQLQRSFSETGGTSFRRELQRVRMARAAELLHDGRLSVQDVAAAVGYRQAAQFAKAFRRSYGAPPSSFRRSNGHVAA
jgi:AraC family transcriptional regulator, regulatory protein of adaptative response / methylphosphotriester-DNA alkyltransferase methyltransferase